MSTTQSEPMLERLAARLTALERELATLRTEQPVAMSQNQVSAREQAVEPEMVAKPHARTSRRKLLRTVLSAAAATAGGGALLETQPGIAQATGQEGPTTFTSATSSTPAMTAVGTGGADGIDAFSDTGIAVKGSGGAGIIALAAEANGGASANPGSLAGTAIYGASSTSFGVYASSSAGKGKAAVSASGSQGADGLDATSDTGTAVSAVTESGTAVSAVYSGIITGGGRAVSLGSPDGIAVTALNNAGEAVRAAGIVTAVHAISGGIMSPGTTFPASSSVFAEGGDGYGILATSTSAALPTISATNTGSNGVALHVEGLLQVVGNAVGQVTLAEGTKTETVANPAVTANSVILLTPLSDPGTWVWISARTAGSFTISARRGLREAVTMQYLIIN